MSQKIHFNVTVIGAGAIGNHHIAAFNRHENATVVALAEASPERGQEAKEAHNIATLTTEPAKSLFI